MTWQQQIETLDNVLKEIKLSRPDHNILFNCLAGLRHTILTLEAKKSDNDKGTTEEEALKNFDFNGHLKKSL